MAHAIEFNVRLPDARSIAIIDLHGQLDAFAGDALDRAYEQAVRPDFAILFNFRDVDYINSTGIAIMIGFIIRATKAGHRLLACGLSEHYRRVFQLARLSDYIGIFSDEAEAVSSVQNLDFHI